MSETSQCEVGRVKRLIVKSPEQAFVSQAAIDAQWGSLNYLGPPDYARAMAEFDAFAELLDGFDIEVHRLPADKRTGMDSIYVRDASIVCDAGAILCSMGKRDRTGEPAASGDGYRNMGETVLGRVDLRRPRGAWFIVVVFGGGAYLRGVTEIGL